MTIDEANITQLTLMKDSSDMGVTYTNEGRAIEEVGSSSIEINKVGVVNTISIKSPSWLKLKI